MGCDNNDMDGFYRPVPRFNGSGLGVFLSPEVREMETEADYAEARLAKMNAGERALFGMLHLGGAFRFIEKLSSEGEIDFQTRRRAGNLICDAYEDLRQDAHIWIFSRGNPANEGCL
jgi:hypothetical protein